MAEPRPSEMSPSQFEKYLTKVTAKRYRFYGWLSNAEKLNLETYEGIMQGIADKLIDRELNKLGPKKIVDLINSSALSRCDKVGYAIGILDLMQIDFQYVDGMEVALLYWLNQAYQEFFSFKEDIADTQLCMDQEAERNQQLGYYDDYNGNGPLDAEHVERQVVDMMKRLNCRIINQGGIVKFLKKYQRYYDWKDLVDGTWYRRYYHCSGLDFKI